MNSLWGEYWSKWLFTLSRPWMCLHVPSSAWESAMTLLLLSNTEAFVRLDFFVYVFSLAWIVEHNELQQKLEKKERECDAKAQEKEEMMQTLNKMKEKLEKESSEHKLVKQQVADLSARLHEMSNVCYICT